eukprot:3391631-Alexandrium_andersonii.AAC.1
MASNRFFVFGVFGAVIARCATRLALRSLAVFRALRMGTALRTRRRALLGAKKRPPPPRT